MRSVFLSVVVAVLMGGCGLSSSDESPPAQASRVAFSEPKFKPNGSPPLDLGEDCSPTGQHGCRSGICLHHRAEAKNGFVCSRQCSTDRDCPTEWSCRAIHPDGASGFCMPPQDWKPKKAKLR